MHRESCTTMWCENPHEPRRWPECATKQSPIAKPTTHHADGDRRPRQGARKLRTWPRGIPAAPLGIASGSRRSIDAPAPERRARQAAISLALLGVSRPIAGLPSPHHAAGPLASEELPPHQAMDVRKEFPVQHVLETGNPAWIGAIERQGSRSPAKPDHRAPFRGDCVLFSQQHGGFSLHMNASFEKSAARRQIEPSKLPESGLLFRPALRKPNPWFASLCGAAEASVGFVLKVP
jgi:hypothetical protein